MVRAATHRMSVGGEWPIVPNAFGKRGAGSPFGGDQMRPVRGIGDVVEVVDSPMGRTHDTRRSRPFDPC